ncbi:hypothetical protein AVEN_79343-1 [Araneus ventricosus]|uniref:Helitron helicase-like domain-containing protein n=1 Tax=Araneus ventricosus TaxID=182803 RepID=A0A4Y2J000_ARAVE|nr:hypothetical protein AVEN_79343-1 [Araneus ventricosus]
MVTSEQGGHTTVINLRIDNKYYEVEIDNRWIVPDSPILSKMFQANINVEQCNSAKQIKYICKYISKGSDMTVAEINNATTGVNHEIRSVSKTLFTRRPSTLGFDLARGICHTIPHSITGFISLIITTCAPSNPSSFWKKYKDRFSENIFHQKQTENPDIDLHNVPHIYNETRILLEDMCLSICGKTLRQFGLPVPTRQANNTLDRDLRRETNYDNNTLQHMVEINKPRITEDQRTAYEAVMNFIAEGNGGILFLDAKTF